MKYEIFFNDEIIILSNLRKTYIKNNYNNLYNAINKYTEKLNMNDKPYSKLIWHYNNNIIVKPKCLNCKNVYTNFITYTKGYSKYCSNKCMTNSNITKEKIKNTNLERYGTESPLQNKKILEKYKKTNLERYGFGNPMKSKEILEKVKKTCLERYGVDNVFKVEKVRNKSKLTNLERYGTEYPIQNKDIRNKIKNTFMMKYGHDEILKSSVIREKIKKTNLEKYGYENPMQSDVIKNKIYKHHEKKRIDKLAYLGIDIDSILYYDNDYYIIKCDKCGDNYNATYGFINQRMSRYNVEPCTNCNPLNSNSSGKELELLQFIKDNYSGTILKNDRTILEGKELDIFLPDLNLAFEFNGLYWHSELFKSNDYHINKTIDCYNSNIHLIHIYEDQWDNKKEVVKSRILNLLGKSKRIYARKCIIKEPDSKEVRTFLLANHIQGFIGSKIKIGLYSKDTNELLSLMTYGSLRKNLGQTAKDGSYELLRFCNSLNISVLGGASKMFKYFKNKYNPETIITYADRSWSKGNLYEKLGFNKFGETSTCYHYIVDGKRENRYKYRKSELLRKGFDEGIEKPTEHSMMLNAELYRIFDSGTFKYLWNKSLN